MEKEDRSWKIFCWVVKIIAVLLIVEIVWFTCFACESILTAPSSSSPKTETCGYCDRSFKQGTDSYRNIIRTNLCTSCYNSMKAAEKALGD